jgi:hypothetical protein
MKAMTQITEQCGARWTVFKTEESGSRSFWVVHVYGVSIAKPCTAGFYAASIIAAAAALTN